ncbi:unnamed protein product, partial [Chrysoparadoxa australica]
VATLVALGAPRERAASVLPIARGAALVRYLQAVPELEARGKLPLPDGRPEVLARLAQARLTEMPRSLRALRRSFGPAGTALREFALARPLLQVVARDPGAVAEGRLALSEFKRRWALLLG